MARSMKPDIKKSRGEGDIAKLARELLNDAWEADRQNRLEAANDLKFMAGDQWPEAVRSERQQDGRPMLTINRLPQFVRQVTNEIRQADPAIRVTPVDDGADPDVAKVYDGLIRQIQYQSSASHVFAQAADHQVTCGMGYWRIRSDYVDDTVFDQELRIEAIPNPLSVYFDPAATKPDKSDAMWCIVTEMMPRKAFKAKYPDAPDVTLDAPTDFAYGTGTALQWVSSDEIRIAEVWRKVPVKKELALLEDGSTIDLTEIPKEMRDFMPIVRTRQCETYKVEMDLVSGGGKLEETYEHPGKYIPIVPLLGAEVPLERGCVRFGMVRFARDPQQLYNYYRTASAETIALQPKAPWLVTAKMVAKFKEYWNTAHLKNRPYLPYEPDPQQPGGPKREAPPSMPSALMQEAAIAQDDMKATTGIYDAALGAQGNETSGKAIRARQMEGDTANYHYADNLERSLWHTGRILVDLIPKIYDNDRIVRILGEDGEEQSVPINREVMAIDGMPMLINDLSAGRFDVRVNIGPSYQSRRMEAAESLFELMGKLPPEMAASIAHIGVKFLDIPEAETAAKILKNMVPPQYLADPDDQKAMAAMQAQQQPDPAQQMALQLEMANAEATVRKNQAEAEGKEIDNFWRMQGPAPSAIDIR